MATPTERIPLIENLSNHLQSLEGQYIEVSESITYDLQRGHDRHCTTRSGSKFLVERVLWTMSGGIFMIYGAHPFQYSISSGQLHSVELTQDGIVVRERFETKTERLSVLKAISS